MFRTRITTPHLTCTGSDAPKSGCYCSICCGQNSNSLPAVYVVHPPTPTTINTTAALIVCSGGLLLHTLSTHCLLRRICCNANVFLLVQIGPLLPNHCTSFFRVEILAFLNLVRTSSSGHAETIFLLSDLQSRDCGLSVSGDFARHGGGVRKPFCRKNKKPEMAVPCDPQIRREISF